MKILNLHLKIQAEQNFLDIRLKIVKNTTFD